MSALDHSPPSLTPFRDAFAQVLSELEAIPEAEVLGINIDLPRAVTIALGAFKNIASHREAIASALPTELETYALAAAQAHAAFMAASKAPPIKELATQASRVRQLLCSEGVHAARKRLRRSATRD